MDTRGRKRYWFLSFRKFRFDVVCGVYRKFLENKWRVVFLEIMVW